MARGSAIAAEAGGAGGHVGTSEGSKRAVVSGVNVILAPSTTAAFAASGMLAPDGRCKTLDVNADG